MTTRRSVLILAIVGLAIAGCGDGGDKSNDKKAVTPKDRIASCLDQQPDATQSDCEGWEKDGMLSNDGTHKNHENMGG